MPARPMDPHTHTTLPSPSERLAVILALVLPLCGFVAAVVQTWGWGVGASDLWLLLCAFAATGLGITVGFHRLFTHESFKAPAFVRLALGIAGSMALEGRLFDWCERHGKHHRHSDHEGDEHSPHLFGRGAWNVLRGLWHAHVGWILSATAPPEAYQIKRLRADPVARFVDRWHVAWVAASLLLPAAVGFALTGTWLGAVRALVWGGFARIFLVHHVTWSINSLCHTWGSQPFETDDQSRNNALCALLAFGEGWHNAHHKWPWSARHGLRHWLEFDPSWYLIWCLGRVGLAWDIRTPSPEKVAAAART